MESTMPCAHALEAAMQAGDAIVATVHHAVAALVPSWPGADAAQNPTMPGLWRR